MLLSAGIDYTGARGHQTIQIPHLAEQYDYARWTCSLSSVVCNARAICLDGTDFPRVCVLSYSRHKKWLTFCTLIHWQFDAVFPRVRSMTGRGDFFGLYITTTDFIPIVSMVTLWTPVALAIAVTK